jgi:hypothetical protein
MNNEDFQALARWGAIDALKALAAKQRKSFRATEPQER